MVVKFNFHLGKIHIFPLCQAQISALATRARVTLTFDWLAFVVKLVLVGSWTIAQGTRAIFQIQLSTKTSFTANANQSNESVTRARVASAYICAWYRRKNWFLPPWKLIITKVEIDFYHHRKENVWSHLTSLQKLPSTIYWCYVQRLFSIYFHYTNPII